MQQNVVKISDKYQVVIPKRVRKKLKIKPQDKALVYSVGEKKVVVDIIGEDIVERTRGLLKKYDTDGKTFKRMLRDKKKELELEDREVW